MVKLSLSKVAEIIGFVRIHSGGKNVMSLTSMLKGKREMDIQLQTILREIIPTKKQFYTISGSEAFSSKYYTAAPYNLSIPYHSSVVGTAFDYMARFMVSQKIINNKDTVSDGLVAKNSLEILKRYTDEKTSKFIERKLSKGISLINKFVNDKDMKFEELLPYATFMARLEHIFRSGRLPDDIQGVLLGTEESEIIEDLKRLCEVFIERFWIPQIINPYSNVVFNPHFGLASNSCGGADADIYVDGTLYDFKTSKSPGYKWSDIAQLFGYFFLHTISTQLYDNSSKLYGYEIKRLAIYKARYGEIEYIDISSMGKEKMEHTLKRMYDLLLKPANDLPISSNKILMSREELHSIINRNDKKKRKIRNNPSVSIASLLVLLGSFIALVFLLIHLLEN
jgi:hypothetical protein